MNRTSHHSHRTSHSRHRHHHRDHSPHRTPFLSSLYPVGPSHRSSPSKPSHSRSRPHYESSHHCHMNRSSRSKHIKHHHHPPPKNRNSPTASINSTETIKASSPLPYKPKPAFTDAPPLNPHLSKLLHPSVSLIPFNTVSSSLVPRSALYSSKELSLNIYKHFTHVDINDIANIHRKVIVYNLPEVNDDEIQQYFITLLTHLTPHTGILNPIVSLEKKDNGFYYIVEVATHDQVEILKNLDNTEWRGYRIRIQRPKVFFRDYNDTEGKIAIPKEIKKSDKESNNKLYLTGIPVNAKEKEVRDIVESFGQVKYFNLIKDQNDEGCNRGFCFFEYVSDVSTERAIKGLDGMQMGEKKFKIQRATLNNKSYTILNEIKKNYQEHPEQEELMMHRQNKGFTDGVDGSCMEISIDELEIPLYAINPSRVIQIVNMVVDEDLMEEEEYNEIVEDVRYECMMYGTVLNVEIPRPDKESCIAGPAVGKVFVKFANVESAKKARYELSGRKFNGRIVVGSFYPENYFDVREFNYQEKN